MGYLESESFALQSIWFILILLSDRGKFTSLVLICWFHFENENTDTDVIHTVLQNLEMEMLQVYFIYMTYAYFKATFCINKIQRLGFSKHLILLALLNNWSV